MSSPSTRLDTDSLNPSTNSYRPLNGVNTPSKTNNRHSAFQTPSTDDYNFLTIPPREQNRRMVLRFLHQINLQGTLCTCVVCSRECPSSAAKAMDINDIPSPNLLEANELPAGHTVGEGMVLDSLAVTWARNEAPFGYVCNQCYASLYLEERPTMSLASGYWFGAHPSELSGLSVAEKILISRRVPGVYVLYESKDRLIQDIDATLGVNDDLYHSSPPAIQYTLPMTPAQLKTLIRMPISGATLEEAPESMRVRRRFVEKALVYLKKEHPFYADITISKGNLALYPESAIPLEIVEHMSGSQVSVPSMKVYAHRTDANYDHQTDLHQFAWMFPTLVPRLSGPLSSDSVDWANVAQWFMNHSESYWRSNDFFVTWLFKKFTDHTIRRSLNTNESQTLELVAAYSADRDGRETMDRLQECTSAVLATIPGSPAARDGAHSLFWSISTIKSPPTFHLIVEPRGMGYDHPLSYSLSADAEYEPGSRVRTLTNAVELILSELMGTKQLGEFVRPNQLHEHHHGAFGKVSAYLTSMDPDGPHGMRVHIAVWITNAPPFTVLHQNMWKVNFRRDFGRYCDATFANLDARAPPMEIPSHSFVAPNTHQPRREDTLWNAHLMRAAGVEVTARALTSAGDFAVLSRLMARPVRSLVPVEGFPNILSLHKPINGVPDKEWGDNLLDTSVRSRLGEISTPEQIHYLRGGRDSTVSHQTIVINFDAIRRMLYDNFVDLRTKYAEDSHHIRSDVCTLTTNALEDYAARAMAFEDQSFLDFCLTSEESNPGHKWTVKRFRYLLDHNRDDRSRVKLTRHILPHFKGRWIPRIDDDLYADLHRAMVLLLLKPWRYLPDLHRAHTQWDRELSQFMYYADQKAQWTAFNFRFIHEARDAIDGNALAEEK